MKHGLILSELGRQSIVLRSFFIDTVDEQELYENGSPGVVLDSSTVSKLISGNASELVLTIVSTVEAIEDLSNKITHRERGVEISNLMQNGQVQH